MHLNLVAASLGLYLGLSAAAPMGEELSGTSVTYFKGPDGNGTDEMWYKMSEGPKDIYGDNNYLGKRDTEYKSCYQQGKALECHSWYKAHPDVCRGIVKDLKVNGEEKLPASPRHFCLTDPVPDETDCCISWGVEIENMRKSDLYDAAKSIFDACGKEGFEISGRYPVMVNNQCTAVCMSDRRTHCR